MATFSKTLQLANTPALSVPRPEEEVGDSQWGLPEILRVNAELALWHGGTDAAATAETGLQRALDVARHQGTLSWELRAATSLARLWQGCGRASEAHDLLAGTYDRFTEGFGTRDLIAARTLLTTLS
jgi:predicted ATPase